MVETRILWASWHRACCALLAPAYGSASETLYRFTFVDGKIDSVINPYGILETYLPRTLPWTIEELESAIVGATMFWEGWWLHQNVYSGSFSHEHWGMEGWNNAPHLVDMGYVDLLPSSNFTSLEDIRYYMSHYFTERWIEQELSRELPAFVEYNGLLYVNVNRSDDSLYIPVPIWRTTTADPIWETSTVYLIEQEGKKHAVVEMAVSREIFDGGTDEVRIRFIFIDGKIDEVIEPLRKSQ